MSDSSSSPEPRLPAWAYPAGYVTLFAAISLALLPAFRFQINPDGMCYIDVARKLLAGDVGHAINAYWGPLLSWLMVPLLAAGVEPLLAGKVTSVGIGAVTCLAVYRYSGLFGLAPGLRAAVLLGVLPLTVMGSLKMLGPDQLLLCALLAYFSLVFREDYPQEPVFGLLCGLFGGLAFLSKAYGFYFFGAHLLMMTGLHLLRADDTAARRATLRNLGLALAVFAVIAGPWIGVISAKYGGLTIGTSGQYNHAIYGPEMRNHPMHYAGFIPPPDEASVSAWDDPTRMEVEDWGLFDSAETVRHQIWLLGLNLFKTGKFLQMYTVLALPLLLAHLVLLVRPWRETVRDRRGLYPLATVVLFVLPYCTLVVIPRYLWPVVALLPFMGAYLLTLARDIELFTPARRGVAAVLLAVAVAAVPVGKLVESATKHQGGRRVYELAGHLMQRYPLAGQIASNGEWHRTVALAWHMDLQYHGEPGELKREAIVPQLLEQGVDYYFVWNGGPADRALMAGFPEITGEDVPGLEIYVLGGP